VLAVLFFAPGVGDWGFRVTRAGWCQAGVLVMVTYLFACAVAHHTAILRAKTFADQKGIEVNRIGALPIPPSLLDWSDKIRSDNGVYGTEFDLRNPTPPAFQFVPDSPPDPYTALAFSLPEVTLFWQFARFPSIRSFADGGVYVVDLGETRVSNGHRRGPQPFTFRVVFDAQGKVLNEGWLTEGIGRTRIRQTLSPEATPQEPAGKTP
jgi:hypothetical protein